METLKAIDVCAGAGGWACAARGLPIDIIAAFDREPDALATYTLNHPKTECIQCDVTTQDFARWKGIDLILGGIPCESLSVARNNAKADAREMKEFTRLLKRFLSLPIELAARYWTFEEVPQVLPLLPNGTPFLRLNSGMFSAQTRWRVYLGNCPMPPIVAHEGTLADHLIPGPHRISPRIFGKRKPSRRGKSKETFQPFYPAQKSFTITNFCCSRRDAEMAIQCELGWRNMDWREAAALQGFPQNYLFVGNPGRVSKMVAQAVQIDTGRAILKALCQVAVPEFLSSKYKKNI
jgi:site-specific DNA-cytosine methylase